MEKRESLAYGFDIPGTPGDDNPETAPIYDRPATPEEVASFQTEVARIGSTRRLALAQTEHIILGKRVSLPRGAKLGRAHGQPSDISLTDEVADMPPERRKAFHDGLQAFDDAETDFIINHESGVFL